MKAGTVKITVDIMEEDGETKRKKVEKDISRGYVLVTEKEDGNFKIDYIAGAKLLGIAAAMIAETKKQRFPQE